MPDAAIPIFQTVNQQGEATLEVEAFIKAFGLTMEESLKVTSGLAPIQNVISWNDTAIAQITEQIAGYHGTDPTKLHTLSLSSFGTKSMADIRIIGGGVGNNSRIVADAGNLPAGNNGVTILESTGEAPFPTISSFLQIAGVANQWTCNFGRFEFAWPAATTEVEITISHGLGVIPIFNTFIPNIGATVITTEGARSNVSSKFFLRNSTGATGGFNVAGGWFAIG